MLKNANSAGLILTRSTTPLWREAGADRAPLRLGYVAILARLLSLERKLRVLLKTEV
jgi:hypothetical protein